MASELFLKQQSTFVKIWEFYATKWWNENKKYKNVPKKSQESESAGIPPTSPVPVKRKWFILDGETKNCIAVCIPDTQMETKLCVPPDKKEQPSAAEERW